MCPTSIENTGQSDFLSSFMKELSDEALNYPQYHLFQKALKEGVLTETPALRKRFKKLLIDRFLMEGREVEKVKHEDADVFMYSGTEEEQLRRQEKLLELKEQFLQEGKEWAEAERLAIAQLFYQVVPLEVAEFSEAYFRNREFVEADLLTFLEQAEGDSIEDLRPKNPPSSSKIIAQNGKELTWLNYLYNASKHLLKTSHERANNPPRRFDALSELKKICGLVIQKLPQADESGFFVKKGERHSTMKGWERELGISRGVIKKYLKNIDGIKARIKQGSVYTFYSEIDVRQACTELLQKLPKADEFGYLEISGERYSTIKGWEKVLGISDHAIKERLKGIDGIKGRTAQGPIHTFYSETDVRQACADQLQEFFEIGIDGLFIKDGVKHRIIRGWEEVLKISDSTIRRRLKSATGIKCKAYGGQIRTFYSEPDVRKACADILASLPQADESGFFKIEGMKYGTVIRWAKELKISNFALKKRLKSITGIEGKMHGGQIHTFYSEHDVRQACADLINGQEFPQADADGFFEKEGIRYGTITRLAKEMGIDSSSIIKRLKGIAGIKGKPRAGPVATFYPEPTVFEACSDILAKRNK